MSAATALFPRQRVIACLLLAWLCVDSTALGQGQNGPPPDDGVFITVNNPITSEVTNRVRNLVEEAKSGKNGRVISKIIFDFNPNGEEASSRDFGPCYDLAKYIRDQRNYTTVAYVHHVVSRHTVLPVLACKELVMGGPEDSWIGKVVEDPKSPLDPQEAKAYEQFAGDARTAIVQRMFDPGVDLMKGRRNNAEFYYDKRRQDQAIALGVVGGEQVMPPGDLAFLNSDAAVRFGLCKLANKANRRQVAEYYGLSAASLRQDPLRGRTPEARLMTIKGEVTKSLKESMLRRIRRAREDGVNTFFLRFEQDFGGGDPQTAREIADQMREFSNDEKDPIQLIAFIPYNAKDTAAFIALGCGDIVMSEDATFGDFSSRVGLGANPRQWGNAGTDIGPIKASLRDLLEKTDRDPVIADGLLDIDVELYRVRTRKGAFERRIITGEELAQDQQSPNPKWQVENKIKHKGKLLVLDAKTAKEVGLARYLVKGRDVREVYTQYGLEPDKVREITPDWLDRIASFLRDPVVRFFLVMIAVACLILEVKLPGATVPGVIAAICFVLFFWAHFMAPSHVGGQIIVLALLLFLLGLVLIGVEIFVLPGFGFVGVSGILLMVVGLGLATVERMPQNSSDWLSLGASLSQFSLGMVVALIGAIILARYLPHIPVANRLMLAPPGERIDLSEESSVLPGVEQAAALLARSAPRSPICARRGWLDLRSNSWMW